MPRQIVKIELSHLAHVDTWVFEGKTYPGHPTLKIEMDLVNQHGNKSGSTCFIDCPPRDGNWDTWCKELTQVLQDGLERS